MSEGRRERGERVRNRIREDFSPWLNYAQHFELSFLSGAAAFLRSFSDDLSKSLALLHNTPARSLSRTEIAVSFLLPPPLRPGMMESRGCEAANFRLHKTAEAENGFSVGECGGQREGGSRPMAADTNGGEGERAKQ